MRRNYIREKKIICGDSYMAVCLYAITPQERNTRGKKQKKSGERQKARNKMSSLRKKQRKVVTNFTKDGFFLSGTFEEIFLPDDFLGCVREVKNYKRRVIAAICKRFKIAREKIKMMLWAVRKGKDGRLHIRNITFRDCYNGHVIQVAGSDNVLIENCRFEGQSFRGSGDKTRELLQIEPGTVKGYPYTLVQNKAPSTNVTIRNCYFGGSENTPHYMAAIGTHSQQAGVKCSDIVIEDCTFDNAAYTAIHFMAYDRITIRNNIFTITSDSEQIDRYGILADTYGSFIDPTGAESTTDFTIEGNTFDVSDPKATVLEITTNNKSPKHIKNVTIKDNTLKGVNGGKAIDLYLLDNCTISGNTIEGFERPIVANSCDEQFISDTDIVTE